MSKFKVGDTVRCIKASPCNTLKLGDVYTIVDIYQHTLQLEGHVILWRKVRFELVENSTSELELLVAKANEGVDAIRELHKRFAGQAEFEESLTVPGTWTDVWQARSEHCGVGKYRVKAKPIFEPFTTSNGWLVELIGDRLHIGCREFESASFKNVLVDLVVKDCRMSSDSRGGFKFDEFYCTRTGIQYGKNTLPWADADEILKRLEKAGV